MRTYYSSTSILQIDGFTRSFDSASLLSRMMLSGKGSGEEIVVIKRLLHNDNVLLKSRYRNTWLAMFKSSVHAALHQCKLASTSLKRKNIDGFRNLQVPDFSSAMVSDLSLPSMAFVQVKIFKTFDVKIGRSGRGTLNSSHSLDWARAVVDLDRYVRNASNPPYQLINPAQTYPLLTSTELSALKDLTYYCLDSSDELVDDQESDGLHDVADDEDEMGDDDDDIVVA